MATKGHAGTNGGPPLLLYGHVDVVTTVGQRWTHPPFGGEIVDGYVWGRGALDMDRGGGRRGRPRRRGTNGRRDDAAHRDRAGIRARHQHGARGTRAEARDE